MLFIRCSKYPCQMGSIGQHGKAARIKNKNIPPDYSGGTFLFSYLNSEIQNYLPLANQKCGICLRLARNSILCLSYQRRQIGLVSYLNTN